MCNIDWIIDDDVRVRRDRSNPRPGYMVASLDGTKFAYLAWGDPEAEDLRLLFSGVDIETESIMAFVGLMDQVDDSPAGDVIFKGETEVWEFYPWDNVWKRL